MTVTELVGRDAPRFAMLERIGAGNHGVVYRAHDRHLRRDVAIKRFAHVLTDDPRAMHRIRREVNALARVTHPNVVTVHDLVLLPDGDGEETPHLVMELVEGQSVRDFLAQFGPSVQSVGLVRRVLDGLEACHRADILHLDIKPANVLVTPSGDVRIVDFGISRAASDLTATIAGTPHYMAPEQYEGKADRRSDLYSVGCLLFETLTGQVPFPGSPAVQLLSHRSGARPDPRAVDPTLPEALARVVQRALAIDPDERFASAAEFSAALEPWSSLPITSDQGPDTQPTPIVRAPRGVLRRGVDAADRFLRAAFVVALLPALVLMSTQAEPAVSYVPSFMEPTTHWTWWSLAVAIAVVHLVRRRARLGFRAGFGAAVRGSAVLLYPWYAAAIAGFCLVYGLPVPDAFGSVWDVAWSLMPLAALGLLVSAVTRVRLGVGSLLMFVVRSGCVAGAMLLFFAYPLAV